jgi:hypothetical protein
LIFYEIKSKELEKKCHETVFAMEKDIRIKGTLARDFRPQFFSSIDPIWDPVSGSKKFSNLNGNSPRYSNSKVIRRSIRIRGKKFFFRVRTL